MTARSASDKPVLSYGAASSVARAVRAVVEAGVAAIVGAGRISIAGVTKAIEAPSRLLTRRVVDAAEALG